MTDPTDALALAILIFFGSSLVLLWVLSREQRIRARRRLKGIDIRAWLERQDERKFRQRK